MEIILFITLLLYMFIIGSCSDYVDYDFFARLIVGKTYFQTADVAKYDFLSYSKTHPWYDHEWGASVFFYFIQDHFGDVGLQIFKILCLGITFFFFLNIIKLRRKVLTPDTQYPIFNFLFFFIMLQPIANLIFSLRCHHFTFMFFAIWLYVLEKARLEKNYRILWSLIPLMVVWSNIHGGCFMGLGITGIYIIGAIIAKQPFAPFVYTFIASFFSMIINPYGVDYVKFLIKATTMTRPNIVEWQSPFNKYFIFKLIKYKLILLGFIGLSIYRFKKTLKNTLGDSLVEKIKQIWKTTDKTKCLLILIMFLLTLKSMRFITYFVFVLIPFCYDDFYAIFSKRMKPELNALKERIIFYFILIVFILNVAVKDFKFGNWHTIYPLSEIEYLIENEIKGNIFVPFETGSYTAYKLYPNNFILQDGRYEEVYNLELNDDYAKTIVLCALGWRERLQEMHHDAIITYKTSSLYTNLKEEQLGYYLILESSTFALFIKKETYHKLKKRPIIPTSNPDFYKKILWKNQINWKEK